MFRRRIACGVWLITFLLLEGQFSLILGVDFTGLTGDNAPLENRQPTLAMRYMIALQGITPDDAQSTPTQMQPPNRQTPFVGEIKSVPFDFVPAGWAFCEGQLLDIDSNQALYVLIGTIYGGDGNSTFALPDLRERVLIGTGQGPGLPNYQLGNAVGTANPVLSRTNLPAHTHTLEGGLYTGSTGSGLPLDNRQPSRALHFLIAANGEIMIVPWLSQPTGWTRCDGRLLTVADHGYLFGHIGTTYGGNGTTNFALPDLRGRVVVGDDGGAAWPLGLSYGNEDNVLTIAAIAAHTHSLTAGATGATGGSLFTTNNYQPSLGIRGLISLDGVYPSPGNGISFPMLGEMRLIAGPAADGLPAGQWRPLYGTLFNTAEQKALFSLIGTTFGGNGLDTFAVPDLRARVVVGAGGSFFTGSIAGSETLNISIAQLASHAHALLQLRIDAIQHFSGGSVQLTLTGTVGNTCRVDKSDDLVTWSQLGQVRFDASSETITDPNATQAAHRFYKAIFP